MIKFDDLVSLIRTLRIACPWDAAQSLEDRVRYAVEEVAELKEAAAMNDAQHICEEAGDVLVNLVAIAVIAEAEETFDINNVIKQAHDKLVRRHAFLLADDPPKTAEEADQAFRAAKAEERKKT